MIAIKPKLNKQGMEYFWYIYELCLRVFWSLLFGPIKGAFDPVAFMQILGRVR